MSGSFRYTPQQETKKRRQYYFDDLCISLACWSSSFWLLCVSGQQIKKIPTPRSSPFLLVLILKKMRCCGVSLSALLLISITASALYVLLYGNIVLCIPDDSRDTCNRVYFVDVVIRKLECTAIKIGLLENPQIYKNKDYVHLFVFFGEDNLYTSCGYVGRMKLDTELPKPAPSHESVECRIGHQGKLWCT